jgi:hypothetical protein
MRTAPKRSRSRTPPADVHRLHGRTRLGPRTSPIRGGRACSGPDATICHVDCRPAADAQHTDIPAMPHRPAGPYGWRSSLHAANSAGRPIDTAAVRCRHGMCTPAGAAGDSAHRDCGTVPVSSEPASPRSQGNASVMHTGAVANPRARPRPSPPMLRAGRDFQKEASSPNRIVRGRNGVTWSRPVVNGVPSAKRLPRTFARFATPAVTPSGPIPIRAVTPLSI